MVVLDVVGGMCKELFIDYVDIEWGLRAKTMRFQSYGCCVGQMRHDLGDEPIKFFGQSCPARSPLRHYYMSRNAVWLYRQSCLPLQWKVADGWRLLLKYGFYALFAKPRIRHRRMMTLRAWHALCDRLGRLPVQP